MALSTAIYNILRSTNDMTTTFGNRICPIEVPLNITIPAISYRVESVDPTFTQGETKQWDDCRVNITIHAPTYILAETYAGYVRTAITHYRGTTGSELVKETNFAGMSDGEFYFRGKGESSTTGIGVFTKNIEMQIITSA